ncbi:sulfotransferase family 2 domain-containing protein [Pseudoruegeria sp. HB172150]|uniref:sulfotransferase family 2 domain-containing protein n=1 Tax=Pseudoruegeria sp. HB172150 TaxID=2721164 RepID=UPI001551FB0D|nr:sulfotransferase family 2 domain-containing protein [Pseudoruegeria sp. HB172150]
MPISRIGPKLVYFAHVPKCAGSSIENYLRERFGRLALLDRQHLSRPPSDRWSCTSPQHIDWVSLMRMFPEDFFSEVFTVVRHPVGRAVSAYRFQSEVEGTVTEGMSFADWLRDVAAQRSVDPHRFDNHSRPQTEFLPPEGTLPCTVFHLEHGLDAVIPYLDELAGDQGGPRAMGHVLQAKEPTSGPLTPTTEEIALIAEIYAADFARFGYVPDSKKPLAPAPDLSPEFAASNAAARARARRPVNRLASRVRTKVRKWQG